MYTVVFAMIGVFSAVVFWRMLRVCDRLVEARMRVYKVLAMLKKERKRTSRLSLELAEFRKQAEVYKTGFLRLADKYGDFEIDEDGSKQSKYGSVMCDYYLNDKCSDCGICADGFVVVSVPAMCVDYPNEYCIGCGECDLEGGGDTYLPEAGDIEDFYAAAGSRG